MVSTKAIFRERVSAVVVHNDKLLCFFAIDPTSGTEYFFLPGGGIEAGESEEACALRETFEETGYKIKLSPVPKITAEYPFEWDGKTYQTRTHFYKAELAEAYHTPASVNDQEYNKGPRWIPLFDLEKCFSYTPEILDAIGRLI